MAEKSHVTGTLLHAGLVWSLPTQSYNSIFLGPEKTGLLRLILCPQCIQGLKSELCGPFPPPQACGLKRFRELRNGSVLWFGFLFVILPLP